MASPQTSYVFNQNSTTLPAWYSDLVQQIVGRGIGLADQPYTPYPGPRVAPLNADQLGSFDTIRGLSHAADPYFGAAGSAYGAAGDIAGQLTHAADPYFGYAGDQYRASAAPINTDFQGAIRPGVDMLKEAGGRNTWEVAQPYIDDAKGYLASAASGRSLDYASPYIQRATDPNGLVAASPYLSRASTSFPEMASAYMNPYSDAVVSRLGALAGRNLSENLLPAISDDFIRAGGYGSLRHRDLVGRTVRDLGEYTLGKQSEALERGYGLAGQLYGQDTGRYAGLASTAGNLGLGQQNLLLGAGSTVGGLAGADYSRLLGAGQSLGQFGLGLSSAQAADAARLLQAGATAGQLGLSAAQAAAVQAEANRTAAFRSGEAMQNLGVTGLNALGNAANTQLAVGNAQQGLGVTGLNALTSAGQLQNQIGGQQQGQVQTNYNTGYQDWQNQQAYPWQNLSNLSGLVNGQQIPTTTTGAQQVTQPGPNTAAQIGGLVVGGLSAYNALNRSSGGPVYRARGGRITRPKRRSRGGLESISYRMAA